MSLNRSWRSLWGVVLVGLLVNTVQAATLVVTPAKAAPGAQISVVSDGLSALTSYQLEFVGSPATNIGTALTADFRGRINTSVVLPNLPVGAGKMRLKTTGQISTVVAYTTFTALSAMTFTAQTSNPAAGQSFRFGVGGLSAGTLSVLYEDASVLGPVVVSAGSYSGKFVLPTNRPAVLPGPARIKLINRVGKVVVSQREVTINVAAKPASPFTLAIVSPPPTQVRPSAPVRASGTVAVVENEFVPERTTLWFEGDDGRVYPLSAARIQRNGSQYQYTIEGGAPGAYSMTAGGARQGQVRFGTAGQTPRGVGFVQRTDPADANLNILPEEFFRLRVKVTTNNGTPIPGAVVQMDGAPVLDPSEADGESPITMHSLLSQIGPVNQLTHLVRLTDDFGCPITLQRQLSSNQGLTEFLYSGEDLMLATLPFFECGGTGCEQLGPRSLSLAINASAQGYGFQFPPGHPQQYDFLPHRYNVFYGGAGTEETTDDSTSLVDWYQDVEVAFGGRDMQFTLGLPPITQKVVLYDIAAKPWVAHGIANGIGSGEGFATVTQQFGPVNSQLGVNSAWISELPGQGYPTELTVRTDPAITGQVSSAKLYLDLDRNNSYESVRNFTGNGAALDCTIEGLDTSLTWRAPLPNVRQISAGLIKGYAEFIGAPNAGQVKQKININLVQRNLSWLSGSRMSGQSVTYGAGGQNMRITAAENNGNADIQLDRDPGHDIGRLRNQTNNLRMLDLFIAANGQQTSFAPIDSSHRGAGRQGTPTSFEAPIGYEISEHYTLIDNSFPLFYYVWGVPLLAGIEFGANFNILAEIDISGETEIANSGQPKLTMTTTPSLDLGLNFYLDIDVLFDLVDGGVDLDAVFALDMPVTVRPDRNPVVLVEECFTASLIFSWHFEFFCLPFDFICDALNDIDGSEILLSDQVGDGCNRSPVQNQGLLAGKFGRSGATKFRPSARIDSRHSVTAYSTTGAGLMAFTRVDPTLQNPPKLVVRPIDGGDFSRVDEEITVSTAVGIRSIDLVFFDDSRALMVWAESADSYAAVSAMPPLQRLTRQRLMYSVWNGETWTAKAALTTPSGGEGGVDLAACPAGAPNCPVDGEAFLVWTRDTVGDMTRHRSRILYSRYTPSTGMAVPRLVDGSASAVLDTSPSAAYVQGQRAVAFVRSTNGVFADTDARRIAYRLMNSAGVQVPGELPGGVAWPSIIDDGAGGFYIAHTHAEDPAMFVGNKQRVALARGSACVDGVCAISAQALTDQHGRAIYGERPQALADLDGNVQVVLRGTGFGNDLNGDNSRDGDPIGMALHTGDLISLHVRAGNPVVTPLPLTADGAGHFAPHASFDPVLGQVVVVGTRGNAIPFLTQNQFRDAHPSEVKARAVSGTVDGDLAAHSLAVEPDLRVEDVTLNVVGLRPGAAFTASAKVRNIGARFVAPPTASVRIAWSWDAPVDEGGLSIGARNIGSMDTGALANFSVSGTVPPNFKPDEEHRLYARILVGSNPFTDADVGNNDGSKDYGGMPLVQGLNASAVTGTTLVQLVWEAPIDPHQLVEGYRIWCHDGDGQWRHLGSSFELGFLDLGAPLNVARHYRVTSYSKNMIESPPGTEAVATATLGDPLFASGFE